MADHTAEDLSEYQRLTEVVEAAQRTLREAAQARRAVVLRLYLGRTQRELAALLGMSTGRVDQLVSKAQNWE